MAINFPDSPTTGDTHTVGPVTWEWDGSTWKSQGTQEVLSATSPLSYDGDTKVVSVDLSSYYTSAQTDSAVSTAISNLVDTAPTTLDTLNELAAALGDDPNFATTVTNSIAEKAPLTQAVEAKTGAYTLVAGDRGDIITANGTFTITVPGNVFAAGDRVDFINIGTGVITFAGSSLTLNSKDSAVTIDSQYAGATILFGSATVAYLIGAIA